MKHVVAAAALGLVLTLGVSAQNAEPSDSTKLSDLTVGDLKSLASSRMVEFQKMGYVRRAEIASFVLPGLGQYVVGDPLGGTLNLAGQVALIGGTFYAAWALLPPDARNASGSDRRSAIGHAWASEPASMVPSTLVMVGGLTLSVLQRFWASDDAGRQARANIASGKVTFQPFAGPGFFGMRGRY